MSHQLHDGKRVSVRQIRETDAPLEAVFELIRDSTTWGGWSFAHYVTMERLGAEDPHGPGAIRVATAYFVGQAVPLTLREEIVELVPNRRICYRVLDGVPVIAHLGEIDFIPREGGGTRIEWTSSFYPEAPEDGPILRRLTENALRIITRQACLAVQHPAIQRPERLQRAA
ncbi:SRPBCC family protein [Inquilinus sp. OTU3971]|uniref:SRPBCC family protein n=1 Tax=Inquilinus sp. OTU3971 TaxID=3043855 RepID=UPI00313BB492